MRIDNRGFSLVEALVAGIASLIIATVIYTIYIMHDRELSEGTARSLLQRQYEVLAGEIGDTARHAFVILASSDPAWTADYLPGWAVKQAQTIKLIAPLTHATLTGFRISELNVIEQYNPASDLWTPFYAGGNAPVRVANLPNFTNSFILSNNRNMVTINLVLTTTYKNKNYYHFARGDAFTCRN